MSCIGCSNIHKASLSGEIDKILKYIEDDDNNINAKDKNGITPLMYAVQSNNTRVIQLLLSNGADVNIKNNDGDTALCIAYERDYFEAFKLLLENRAKPGFIKKKNVKDLKDKTRYFNLIKEYFLYTRLKKSNSSKNIYRLFDMYFSLYSNGYYSKNTQKLFKDILQKDYKYAADKKNKQNIENFINRYSKMGKNYYLISTASLNIRKSDSVKSESLGEYSRGDKVFILEKKEEWFKTERGWINKKFTKQILKEIPFVSQYITKASKHMDTVKTDNKKPGKIKKTIPSQKRRQPAYSPKKKTKIKTIVIKKKKSKTSHIETDKETDKGSKKTDAQEELEAALNQPTLESLEAFIKKYNGNKSYAPLVEKARKKYKSILLDN